MGKEVGSHENGDPWRKPWAPSGSIMWHPTNGPLLSLPVTLDSWQSLALSSAIIDPSIRNFDVAHISTAAMGNFSAARDRCLWGKGSVHPLGRGWIGMRVLSHKCWWRFWSHKHIGAPRITWVGCLARRMSPGGGTLAGFSSVVSSSSCRVDPWPGSPRG